MKINFNIELKEIVSRVILNEEFSKRIRELIEEVIKEKLREGYDIGFNYNDEGVTNG